MGIKKIAGTVPLQPTGTMAMSGQRYPITEIGILNLTKRLIEVGEQDKNFGECEVKFYKGAKINNRVLHLHSGRAPRAAQELQVQRGPGVSSTTS